MAFERFDFDIEKAMSEIKKRKAKKVLLQFPEGIKQFASEIAEKLSKKTQAEIILSGESNWGGCDLALEEAKTLKADLLIHFGHLPFIKKVNFPVIYIPIKDNFDISQLLKNSLAELSPYKNLALVSSVQHLHLIQKVKEFYEKNSKQALIPKAIGFAFSPGHIVGCEYSGLKLIKKDIQAVVAIGNRFHGLGAALAIPNKPVFLLDTYNNKIEEMSALRNKLIKQRAIALSRFEKAKDIGIIIGLKPGQKFGTPNSLKAELEKLGKNVSLITMREFTPEKLMNFYNIEAFVELACPRIATDDYSKYEKPILTFRETLVALKRLSWKKLLNEGFL
ncbi:MAG: diphthamide biosynthesis enzyme Dph2 [Nanoarchaeota archaeon]